MDRKRIRDIGSCINAFRDKEFWKVNSLELPDRILMIICAIPIILRDLVLAIFSRKN